MKALEQYYLRMLEISIYYYYINFYKFQKKICQLTNQGILDLLILPNVVNYFVWEKMEPIKKYSENAVFSYFMAGHFCQVRGYYTFKYLNAKETDSAKYFPF